TSSEGSNPSLSVCDALSAVRLMSSCLIVEWRSGTRAVCVLVAAAACSLISLILLGCGFSDGETLRRTFSLLDSGILVRYPTVSSAPTCAGQRDGSGRSRSMGVRSSSAWPYMADSTTERSELSNGSWTRSASVLGGAAQPARPAAGNELEHVRSNGRGEGSFEQ